MIDIPSLLERDAELASLEALIGAASDDRVERLVVIEGPAGIGKTRLLGEARARAEAAGMAVLSARGSELEHEFGYGVVRQLFERLLGGMSDEDRAEVLGGAAAPAAPVLGPAAPVLDHGGDTSFSTLHGLYWATVNLAARRPLLLVIDDLHWCDPLSLRWLAYVVRRIEGLALLIAVALRPAEPGADTTLLTHVTHDPHARVLRPAALSEAAASRLVRAALSEQADAAFCAACHDESGGNPLLLGQLLSAVAAEGMAPSASEVKRLRELGANAVSRVVALRFARLPEAAVALAGAVAILGDGSDLHLAASLAGLGDDDAHAAAAELSRVDILQRELPLAFVHPMVGAAVRERIPPPERARGHARAARLLAAAGAPAEAVAAQAMHARPAGDAWAVTTLREAARKPLRCCPTESAVAYLRRALAEPPAADERFDLLVQLATAEMLVDGPAAVAHFEEAHALAGTPEQQARIAVPLASSLYLVARPDDALTVLMRGIEQLGPAHQSLRRELEVTQLTIARTQASHYPLALELFERLAAAPAGTDLTGRSLSGWLAFHDAYVCASRDESLERAREALGGGLLIEHANGGGVWAVVVMALLAAEDEEAARMLEASLAEAHRRGSGLGFAAAKVFGSRLALLRGELAEAEGAAREGLEACEEWGIAFGPVYAGAYLADALMERGRVAEAAATLASAGGTEPPEFKLQTSWFLESCARLLLRQGRLREGASRMFDLGRGFEGLGGRNPAFHPWRSEAALALLALGERRRARELATDELELARSWGAPYALGRALCAVGLVEGGESGLALLREAVEVLEPSTARLEHAKALVELGAALRRANRRREAREPLRRGLELATICEATPVGERAETELLATGARLGRIALSGVGSLTPSERRVADLAAAGASNREIAQTLFVTVKTVEVHLSSVYRKLDIASRAKLASALAAS